MLDLTALLSQTSVSTIQLDRLFRELYVYIAVRFNERQAGFGLAGFIIHCNDDESVFSSQPNVIVCFHDRSVESGQRRVTLNFHDSSAEMCQVNVAV